jgi:hypothetical protein
VPDILNVTEYFGEESEHYLEHPSAEKQYYKTERQELGDDRKGHVSHGCYGLKERYRYADYHASQQDRGRYEQCCFQRMSAEVKYEIAGHPIIPKTS